MTSILLHILEAIRKTHSFKQQIGGDVDSKRGKEKDEGFIRI